LKVHEELCIDFTFHFSKRNKKSSRKRIIKKKNIPLNVVRNAKRPKISHIKETVDQPVVELQNDADDQGLVYISYETEDAVLDHSDMQQPTSHTRRKLKAAENWENL